MTEAEAPSRRPIGWPSIVTAGVLTVGVVLALLFGSDLVTRHDLPRGHYVSRYWCQRTLWESEWEGRSPIADPDFAATDGGPPTPPLRGLGLPPDVLRLVYHDNARRILRRVGDP